MMKLLDTDGAWIAIGISVFFIIVGLVMKHVFVNILKNGEQAPISPLATSETPKND
jgi:hypothetical protein